MFNFGSVPTAFAFDPSRPQTLYAGAEAVYKQRRRRAHLAHGPAGPGEEHGGAADWRPRRPRLFTDDPAYPGSGRSVTIHAIAVDEDDPARVFVAASAADSPVPGTPASPTLLLGSTDGGRTWSRVTAFGSERVFALRGDGGGRRRECTRSARPACTRRRAVPAALPAPGGAASPRAASGATRARAWCSPTPPCRSSPGRAGSPAACRCRRTAAAPGAPRTARCSRPCAWTTAATSGGPPRARGRRSARSRPPPASRSSPTWACAASCSPAAATSPSTGSRRRRTADTAGASCTRSRTSRRPTSTGRGSSRAPRRTGTRSGSTRPTTSRWRRTIPTSRTRPISSAPTGPSTAARLGAGQLREPRRRPLDDPRPRRHHHLRRPVRPVRREARVHPLHRHRPLPQRRRGRDLDGLLDGHPHAAGATRPTGSPSTPR